MNKEIDALIKDFYEHDYILNEALATSIFLLKNLEKPLLLEGNPGVGKTMLAKTLAEHLGTNLIRLQCYEGLDVSTTIYEWNYQKQLLHIKLFEQDEDKLALQNQIFGMDYVLQRPLLQSISADKPVVLLIDEIDRADEEFEASKEASRLEKHPEKDLIKKIRDMIAKEKFSKGKNVKEAEGYSKHYPGGKTPGLTDKVLNTILTNMVKDKDEKPAVNKPKT